MTENINQVQDIEPVAQQDILAIVQDIKFAGYRLGQICATEVKLKSEDEGSEGTPGLEILYTFEKDNVLKNYKITVNADAPELQSVTAIFPYAFVYENEMHDLFGISFKNLALDYKGTFYKIAKKTPWNPLSGKGGEN